MHIGIWLALALALTGIWLALNHVLFHDIFSPFALLLPTWILPIFLTLTNLSDKVNPWQGETILMLVTMTLIVASISLGSSLPLSKRSKKWDQSAFSDLLARINSRAFTNVLISVHIVGVGGLVYNELVTNPVGIPMLAYLRDPDLSRDPNWLWKGGATWFLSLPAFALGPFLYLKFRTARGILLRMLYFSMSISYPFVELIKMSRSECIYAVTALGMAEYYFRKHTIQTRVRSFKLWQRLLVVSVLVVLAIASSTIFSKIRSTRSFSEMGDMMGITVDLPEPFASTVMEFYVYFGLPFENFNNLVNNYPGGQNLGVGGFRPLYSITGGGRVVRDKLAAINMDGYLEMLPANTYPVIAYLYLEAGWLSVIIFSILYSLGINGLYVQFRKRPTATSAIAYMLPIPFLWMWMFSNSNFTGIQYYLIIVIGVSIPWLLNILRVKRRWVSAPLGENLQTNHVTT